MRKEGTRGQNSRKAPPLQLSLAGGLRGQLETGTEKTLGFVLWAMPGLGFLLQMDKMAPLTITHRWFLSSHFALSLHPPPPSTNLLLERSSRKPCRLHLLSLPPQPSPLVLVASTFCPHLALSPMSS